MHIQMEEKKMKNTWKKISVIAATGVLTAGMSMTAFAADTGSAAAKYTYHALDSEELAGDATWLDLAQKSSQDQGTDKAPAAPDGNGQQPSGQKPSGDGKGQQPDGSQAKDAPTEGSSAKASDNTSKSDKTQKKPDKAPADNSAEAASKPDQKPDQAPDQAPADASSSSSMPKEDDSRVKEEYVDTDAVQKAIDGITDDDDLKSSLQTLLDAYTDALDAEKDGLDASDTSSDTLDTLHTAVMDARSALLSALKDAGIETEKLADPVQAPAQENVTSDNAASGSTVAKAADNGQKNSTQQKNVFSKAADAVKNTIKAAGNWVSGLFRK